MKEKPITRAEVHFQKNVLWRLQTLIDVIYGLMIFHLFTLFPRPTEQQLADRDLIGMFAENGTTLLVILIGIVLLITYWSQSNRQFGFLIQVDERVATLAIVQVFSLLIYLYFVRLENETDGDEFALLMESIFLSIAGFLGIYNWNYCKKKGFFNEEITSRESNETVYGFYAEPVVAALTIPLVFIGAGWYSLGWIVFLPLAWYITRRKKKKLTYT